MLQIKYTTEFKKDIKKAIKQGKDIDKMKRIITILQKEEGLSNHNRDHYLNNSKDYHECKECHIDPDWLLIYKIAKHNNELLLIRIGSHSELF